MIIMENKNDNKKGNRSMMWMMVPCLIILLIFVFAGGARSSSWFVWVLMGGFVAAHLWMMFRGHGSPSGDEHHAMADMKQVLLEKASPADGKDKKKNQGGGSCCH